MALTVLVGFSACFAASEGIRATQSKSRKEEHRSRKNNLIVHCTKSSCYSAALEGRRVVLSGEKLYIDTGTDPDVPFGHPFAGYYLGYPDAKHAGLVSTISDEWPILNWIYVHKDTYELKFGGRPVSDGNITGPYDCTRQDRRLTLEGWEGFVAVLEGDFWALYFDVDNDMLKSKVAEGTPVLEVELFRKEMKQPKPPARTGSTTNGTDGSSDQTSSSEGKNGDSSSASVAGSGLSDTSDHENVQLPEAPELD